MASVHWPTSAFWRWKRSQENKNGHHTRCGKEWKWFNKARRKNDKRSRTHGSIRAREHWSTHDRNEESRIEQTLFKYSLYIWLVDERRLHTVFLFYRNTLHNKIFQTLMCVRIHLCKQTSQQYFASKSVRFRIRHTPLFLLLMPVFRVNTPS